ncbi:hypothetical protein GE061_003470 [Apolygus lucorum]|uniref:Globin domain-containing protein n=1 Tax=Apolygus lucorum TaxID=248454 RepID=A0A6A4JFF3_APOLU|nr:hypothetical protein GE061_003470 [Apolygus lucorum]
MSRTFLGFSQLLVRRLFATRPARFGLTEEEVVELRDIWRVVDQSPIPVAKIVFKDLFEKKPEYSKKFISNDKFHSYDRDVPLLHQNEFIPHMRAVVTALTNIIKRIENEKEVDRVMDYIAVSHSNQWVKEKEMEDMGKSFKSSLKILNKNKMTEKAEVAFDKFWSSFVEDYMTRIKTITGGATQGSKK